MALSDSAFVVVGVPTEDTPNARGLASDAVTDNIGILDHGAGNALQLTTEYNLKALAEVDSLGLVAYTGSHAFTPRTITSSGSIAVTNGNGQGGNPTLNVVDNTSTQRVNVTYGADGTPVGAQSTLNFINGSNATVGLYNNIGQNRIDVTVSATGGGGGGGGVTEITARGAIAADPNPIVSTADIDLVSIHEGTASYTNANITVDQYGRVTEASNGSGGGGGSGFTLNVQNFVTGTGTYEPTANMKVAFVQMWGAGGSGGWVESASEIGAGGGGGGYVQFWVESAAIGPGVPYAIGAGGAGVTATTGNDGGDTTFGTAGGLGTAQGGGGGDGAAPGLPGGGSSGEGTIGEWGFSGLIGGSPFIGADFLLPGMGGTTYASLPPYAGAFMIAKPGSLSTIEADATTPGTGGMGNNDATASGTGGNGQILITEYCWE